MNENVTVDKAVSKGCRILVSLVLLTVLGCNPMSETCSNSVLKQIVSPDKKYKAIIFTRDCGATTGFSTQLSLVNYESTLENERGNVLIISDKADGPSFENGGAEVQASWNNEKELVIFYNTSVETFAKQTKFENLKITYSPLPSEAGDKAEPFKIGNYRVTPKPTFDFHSMGKSSRDTLNLVSCSNYVLFPFGVIKDKSDLKISVLKKFTIANSKRNAFVNYDISQDTLWYESLELKSGINELTLFLDNDPEASIHSNISHGKIYNSNVDFINNIRIGISINEFYKTFFDVFPSELEKEFKVIEVESCVNSIKHIYSFENGKLSSVKFEET